MNKKYSKKFLLDLYRTMFKIRIFEESLVEPILKGEIRCPCHLYTGQEAIAVGVCFALEKEDYVFGTHRSHGHYIAKGGDLYELAAEIYGKESGCSKGRGGSMHVIYPQRGFLGAVPIVGGTISLATGAALTSKIKGNKRVTVSFFGDGAVGEGVLYECLNFAALKKLPIIFACENNQYSTHMPLGETHPGKGLFEIGKPFGIPSFKIDGNNVLKVYEAIEKVVRLCREEKGPVFIEFLTYRLRGHVGPDDNIQGLHTDIRPKEEVEKWRKKDPIRKFKNFLITYGLPEDVLSKIEKETYREVENAIARAKKAPYPKRRELTRYVFKE